MEDVKPSTLDIDNTIKGAPGDEMSGGTDDSGIIKRVQLPEDEKLEQQQFLSLWQEQNRYIDQLESKLKVNNQNWLLRGCCLIIKG